MVEEKKTQMRTHKLHTEMHPADPGICRSNHCTAVLPPFVVFINFLVFIYLTKQVGVMFKHK